MITKKHGVKYTKRDNVVKSFYLLEVYKKTQVIGEDHPLKTVCSESKFELIDMINFRGLSMYNYQLFKISQLKL